MIPCRSEGDIDPFQLKLDFPHVAESFACHEGWETQFAMRMSFREHITVLESGATGRLSGTSYTACRTSNSSIFIVGITLVWSWHLTKDEPNPLHCLCAVEGLLHTALPGIALSAIGGCLQSGTPQMARRGDGKWRTKGAAASKKVKPQGSAVLPRRGRAEAAGQSKGVQHSIGPGLVGESPSRRRSPKLQGRCQQ